MARTTPIDMGRTNRQGTSTSSSYRVPADATGHLCITLQHDTLDFVDASKRVRVWLQRFDTVTQQWVVRGSAEWIGTLGLDILNPENEFAMCVPAYDLRGEDVRIELDVPTRIRVGCKLHHDT